MSEDLSHLCPPISAGDVKKGDIVMMKGQPCKILESKHSKTGKHGHAKANMTGTSLITGKKYNTVEPGHITMNSAVVEKGEYMLMEKKDSALTALDDDGNEHTFDVEKNDDFKKYEKEIDELGEDNISDAQITVMVVPQMNGKKIEKKFLLSGLRIENNA